MLSYGLNTNKINYISWLPIPILVSGEMSSTFVEPCKSIYSKLNESETIESHMTKITDINQIIEGLQSKIKNPSICILPEGPQTIPYKA